jgi:caffeoyl-CoA O-methyltransferase
MLIKQDRLLRPGGLIIADNTLLWGEVLPGNLEPSQMASAMREFNNMAANHDGYDAILLPTVEGMTVARKKLIV